MGVLKLQGLHVPGIYRWLCKGDLLRSYEPT